jgi:DNA repair protein RecN (Recombination protein N)
MLVTLIAENLAIMDKAELQLGKGFTSITGETGTGKSLLVGAISLCLGERADTAVVRSGCSRAVVQAVFEIDEAVNNVLKENGCESEENLLYIHREIAAEGRGLCRLNGRLVPIAVLKRVGDLLVDLHGQHEHQSLLDPTRHLSLLDEWLGETIASPRQRAQEEYEALTKLRGELRSLEQGARERAQRLDLLKFQVSEIEDAAISPGEIERLEGELLRLKHAESLAQAIASASEVVFAGENSAVALLSQASKSLVSVAGIDPNLDQPLKSLGEAQYSLDDAIDGLRKAESSVVYNQERVEEIGERLDLLARLKRKYGNTEEDIIAFCESVRGQLTADENSDERAEALKSDVREMEDAFSATCAELSKRRVAGGRDFCDAVCRELSELAMPHAKLNCAFRTVDGGPTGSDDMQFFFTANPGEAERPLARVASGGEVSRVMLAIKTVLAGSAGVPTLVFDEIDTGLGGQTAAVVAKKIEGLARSYQVIVITHLPQIAGKADAQIAIEKAVDGGRSVTRIRLLEEQERVAEIARMLAGDSGGKAAEETARQLIAR